MASLLFTLSIIFFVAGGVLYSSASALGHGDALSDEVCTVGGMFCHHPGWLFVAGAITLFLAVFARLAATAGR
jgi:hypothetical protein